MSDHTFEVLSPLHHNAKRYRVGETVKMATEQAEPLVRAGCLKPGPLQAPVKTSTKKSTRSKTRKSKA